MRHLSHDSLSTGQKVGKYTQYQRSKRNWTLSELSDRCGMTSSFLVRLEHGEYNTVKFDVLQKLAKAFDTDLAVFLFKCGLIEENLLHKLPAVEFYLKEKFHFPPEAIEDVLLFFKFIEGKYSERITYMKNAHEMYWSEDDDKGELQ